MTCVSCCKWGNVVKISILHHESKAHQTWHVRAQSTKRKHSWLFSEIDFSFIVTRCCRKLNSVACKWNYKIGLSRHFQTPIFLRDQLKLLPELPTHRGTLPLFQTSETFRPYRPYIHSGTGYQIAKLCSDYNPHIPTWAHPINIYVTRVCFLS